MYTDTTILKSLFVCLITAFSCVQCVSTSLDPSQLVSMSEDPLDSNVLTDQLAIDQLIVNQMSTSDAMDVGSIETVTDYSLPDQFISDHDLDLDMNQSMDLIIDQFVDDDVLNPRRIDTLPLIYDLSQAPVEHVNTLVRQALNGLGIQGESAPQMQDKIFINQFYIAWIDETGFYGKVNGLWLLNGQVNHLEFLLLDQGRPVNMLVVGEHGDGKWPAGYMGAEHFEYPNHVPEEDDNPDCVDSFCAQYSFNEASHYQVDEISSWRACNEGSPSFLEHFTPITVEFSSERLHIIYRAAITKEGDFGGSTHGNHCHENYLFEDGVRRPVFLESGWTFYADDPWLDRLLQVDNPQGNPVFRGANSFVGGFVFTQWPNPHPLKQLHQYIYLSQSDVHVEWNRNEHITIPAQQWFSLPTTVPNRDVVLGWAGQKVSLSVVDEHAQGLALSHENIAVTDNDDLGFCLCTVHGGLEMGGGLIHTEVPGGTRSHQAIRRLYIEQNAYQSVLNQVMHYDAVDDLQHHIGRSQDNGWQATTEEDDRGHLIFGPYTSDWGEGQIIVEFNMQIDHVNGNDDEIAIVDIYDAHQDEVVAQKIVLRSDFQADYTAQKFTLNADLQGRLGHKMESRVDWLDRSLLRVHWIKVRPQN